LGFVSGVQVKEFAEATVESIGVKAASGSEFGGGIKNASDDHGEHQIALRTGQGVEDSVELEITEGTEHGGDMTMGAGASDEEGVG
jgi:hypothetical protein